MNSSKNVCRLCLHDFPGPSNIFRDDLKLCWMLKSILPGLDIHVVETPKICSECLKYVKFGYHIKGTVISNEHKIIENIKLARRIQENTCRLCFKIEGKKFIALYNCDQPLPFGEIKNIIEVAVAELNFNLYKKPIICNNCWQIVRAIYLFKKRCWIIEKVLKYYCINNKVEVLKDQEVIDISNVYQEQLKKYFRNNRIPGAVKERIVEFRQKTRHIDLLQIEKRIFEGPSLIKFFRNGASFIDNLIKPIDQNNFSKYNEISVSNLVENNLELTCAVSKKNLLTYSDTHDGNFIFESRLPEIKEEVFDEICDSDESTGPTRTKDVVNVNDLLLDFASSPLVSDDEFNMDFASYNSEHYAYIQDLQEFLDKIWPQENAILVDDDSDKNTEPNSKLFEFCNDSDNNKRLNGNVTTFHYQVSNCLQNTATIDIPSTSKPSTSQNDQVLKQETVRADESIKSVQKTEVQNNSSRTIITTDQPRDFRNVADIRQSTVQNSVESIDKDRKTTNPEAIDQVLKSAPPQLTNIDDNAKRQVRNDNGKVNITNFITIKQINPKNFTGATVTMNIAVTNGQDILRKNLDDEAEKSHEPTIDTSVTSEISNMEIIEQENRCIKKESDENTIRIGSDHGKSKKSVNFDKSTDDRIKKIKGVHKRNSNKSIIGSTKEFNCNVCTFKTKYSQHLTRHMKLHDDNAQNLDCPKCLYSTKIKRNFLRHMSVHNSNGSLYCTVCEFSTGDKTELKRHISEHKTTAKGNVKTEKETLGFEYNCTECPYVTAREEQYVAHCRAHKSTEKVYKCDRCHYITTRTHSIKDHMQLHDKSSPTVNKYKCEYCSLTYKKKTHLVSHTLVHENSYKFECSECDYKAKRKSHLVTHMLQHQCPDKVFKFQCPHCSYKAKRKEHLRIHNKNIHCAKQMVNLNFGNNKKIGNRVKVRTIDSDLSTKKTTQCPLCSYQLKSNWNLWIKHLSEVHYPSTTDYFQCFHCLYKSSSRRPFIHHLKLHKN